MEGCAFRFLPPAAGPGQFSFPKGLGLTENGPAPSGFRLWWLKKTVATMQAAGCFCEAGLGQGGFLGCTSPLHSYMATAQALLGSTLRIPVSEPSPCHGPLLSSSLSPWRHEVGIFGLKGFGWSLQQHAVLQLQPQPRSRQPPWRQPRGNSSWQLGSWKQQNFGIVRGRCSRRLSSW